MYSSTYWLLLSNYHSLQITHKPCRKKIETLSLVQPWYSPKIAYYLPNTLLLLAKPFSYLFHHVEQYELSSRLARHWVSVLILNQVLDISSCVVLEEIEADSGSLRRAM